MAGLTDALRAHARVGVDTAVFIYQIEGSDQYGPLADEAMRALADGAFEAVVSVVTLMELSVKPRQLGQPAVADEYELLLATYPHLTIADIDRRTGRRAAELRARYRVRPADALQLAACLERGGSAFLTNDAALRQVRALEVLVLSDFVEA